MNKDNQGGRELGGGIYDDIREELGQKTVEEKIDFQGPEEDDVPETESDLPGGVIETRDLQDAAVHFNDVIDSRWPQEKNGELKYYPLGSLVFALYSQAETAYRLDNQELPVIERREQFRVPEKTRRIFEQMTRPIGDFDFLDLDETGADEKPGKGGVMGYEEISPVLEHAEKPHPQLILKRVEDSSGPFFDPLSIGDPDPIQLEIGDEIYHAPSFGDTAVFKALHLLERYEPDPDNERDSRKNSDMDAEFPMVLEAVEPFYNREEMVETVSEYVIQKEIDKLEWHKSSEKEAEREYERVLLEKKLSPGEINQRELDMKERNYSFQKETEFYSDHLKWFGQLLVRSDASEEVKDFFWDVWEQTSYEMVEEARERNVDYRPDIPDLSQYQDSRELLEDIDQSYRELHSDSLEEVE